MMKILGKDKGRTFKVQKNIKEGSKRFELHKQLQATLGSGDLRNAVRLPPQEELNEWLAVNVIDFFNQINLLYGSVTEFCSAKTCPVMSAGPKYEYLWADGNKIKKPIKVSAPEYADYLMTWVQTTLEDETTFPVSDDTPFPKHFKPTVKNIFKRLFRIYAHIYYSHAQEVVDLGVEAHLNTAFKHFYLFIKEFDLVETKEMARGANTTWNFSLGCCWRSSRFSERDRGRIRAFCECTWKQTPQSNSYFRSTRR